ncbi:MAG TPA: DUF5916 domain-containing protein [Vicinamibacterales bacterium]|nr:DUF5916 domain-containing protein [Vicinamibacterales bacterium]
MLAGSLLAASVLIGAAADGGRDPVDIEAIRASKRVAALRIDEPIVIDGVLDEPAWERAEPATDFYQQQPVEFQPSTRRAEVRFLYTSSTLYVGAMLHDEAPQRVIVNDLKRDFGGRDTDSFGVVLDTFHDRRNSYGFLTNPGGAQRETQAYDNGRRADANWHGIWWARTRIVAEGWVVEMAIPFKTLRFPDRPTQEWGLNLVRIVRRDNETTTWAPVPRQFTHYNVAYAGVLTGISGVERGRQLQVKPFLTGQAGHGATAGDGWSGDGDGGFDLKWGITSSMTLDGTYRTDFSQVEADEQQINLTRFGLFFPEKREFFLESPANFQIGIVERDDEEPRRDLLPFFSRRIGLSSDGQPIPVLGGLRLTGRAGRNGVGILTMQTREFVGDPGANFTALRVTREVSSTIAAGAFYFGRESSGPDAFNRVAGADLRYQPSRTLEFEAFAMRSGTDGAPGDWAGRAGLRLDNPAHRARAGFLHVGDAFRHDVGFVRRRGIGTWFGTYARVFRPRSTSTSILEHSLGADVELTTDDRYGEVLTQVAGLNYGVVFSDGGELNAGITSTRERLASPFDIGAAVTVVPGDYRFEDATISYQSNKSAVISGNVQALVGEFWSGSRQNATGGLRVRVNRHLAASVTGGRTDIRLREGSFHPTLLGLRLDCSFTPRMFLNAFVQYNGESDVWLSNVRFNLIHRPLSDIYIVWNETRIGGLSQRTFLFKYTHLIAF